VAERGIGLVKEGADGGVGFGKIFAHADFLGALTGEEEDCVHVWLLDAGFLMLDGVGH
jgi:hypothetical protein